MVKKNAFPAVDTPNSTFKKIVNKNVNFNKTAENRFYICKVVLFVNDRLSIFFQEMKIKIYLKIKSYIDFSNILWDRYQMQIFMKANFVLGIFFKNREF